MAKCLKTGRGKKSSKMTPCEKKAKLAAMTDLNKPKKDKKRSHSAPDRLTTKPNKPTKPGKKTGGFNFGDIVD